MHLDSTSLAMAWWLPALICAILAGESLGRMVPQSHLSTVIPVKYVITGQKNADGRWIEQVKMEHGEEDWHIEVDHMTLEVGEGQPKVKISATFSAKTTTPEATTAEPQKIPELEDSDDKVEGVTLQLFPRSHLNWFGAMAACSEWGGHLAVPDTLAKTRKLTSILRQHVEHIGEPTGAFLGFTDLRQEGHFMTVLGKPLFNTRESTWSPHWYRNDQPDDDKGWSKDGEDCGSLRPNGGLNDVPCSYNLPFICEKAADKEETTTAVAAASEDEGEDTLRLFTHHLLTWVEAGKACEEWGGTLAIPDSQEKMVKMGAMLRGHTQQHWSAFLGFNDIKQEGHFVTIFDKPVFSPSASWTPHWFSPTQPDDDKSWTSEGEDCGAIHPSGGLNDVPCLYRLPYFCQKTPPSETVTPTEESETPKEEEEENVTLRLFDRNDLNWLEASDVCNEWGGHLAIPNTAEKMDVMTSKLKMDKVWAAFLGFGDQDKEGNFVTIFGEPVFHSDSWSPRWWREDQPDDDQSEFKDGEDCGAMRADGLLNDVPCQHRMPFFCEKPRPTGDDAIQVLSSPEEQSTASSENLLGNDDTTSPVETSKEDSPSVDNGSPEIIIGDSSLEHALMQISHDSQIKDILDDISEGSHVKYILSQLMIASDEDNN